MKKLGFTLAEVLITLTLLGVVAAMTLPALTSEVQKHQWVQGFKSNYYDMQQGFQRMMADQDVSDLTDTIIWTKYVGNETYKPVDEGEDNTNNDSIKTEFAKYFSIDSMSTTLPDKYKPLLYNNTNSITATPYALPGTYLLFKLNNSAIVIMQLNKTNANLIIDSNGLKGPNVVGKDMFLITIQRDGTVTYVGKDGTWKTGDNACTNENLKNKSGNIIGWTCTARVIEDGWKMNY